MSAVSVGEIVARLELDSSQFSSSVSQAQAQMQQMGNTAQSLSSQMGLVQKAALAVGGAVVVGIGASAKAAANFEQQMSAVKAVSGATASEMKTLTDLAIKLGESTSFSATETAQATEELVKAGVTTKDIINGGLAGALDLAAAGNLNLADAAEIASTALNAFKADSLSVSKAADILAGAANASATDVGEMKFGLAQVSAVASGIGMSFKDTATALAVFAQNGIKGSDAGTSLKTMLSRLEPQTKQQREEMMELGIITSDGTNKFFDQAGSLKDLATISGILQNAFKGLTDQQRQSSLQTLFGSDAVRAGTVFYKEGAKGVEDMAAAMSKVTAAEVSKVKLDNFLGSVEELSGAVETLGIKLGNEFLPHLRKIVDIGADLVRAFSSINPSVVATGLAMAGTSAAIALTASSAIKLGFALRGLFAAMGPAGWVITGLSILGGLMVGVSAGYKAMNTVSLEAANAKQKEVDGINKTIKEYDGLQSKMKLTNDELLRYLDNKDALANEKDSAAIKKLNAEQDGLRKSSGLTNEEFDRFLQLNDQIIKKSPETEAAFSAQGNAIAKNTEAMKAYSKEKYEELSIELEKQATIAERNEDQNLAKVKQLQTDINKLKRERNDLEDGLSKQKSLILQKEMALKSAEKEGNAGKISMAQHELDLEKFNLKKKQDQYAEILKQVQAKNKSLGETQKELGKLDQVKQKQVALALQQVGLNAKKGQGVAVLDKEIMKLKDARANLINNTTEADKKTAEYRESLAAIEKELSQLDQTKNKVIDITSQAEKMNNALGKDLSKYITIFTNDVTRKTERAVSRGRGNEGTYHVGGIVGKPAGKLHSGGMASKFGNPMSREVDIRALRNEMVLTEAQQSNLFRLIDAGHTARITSATGGYSPQMHSDLLAIKNAIEASKGAAVIMDSEVIGRLVEPHVSRRQMDEIDRSSY
ncbi:phage tail tape measure protein [Bacillus pumilus]|uniref:phage tail tape measure protein n=1 Tax=Bacillus pumilus TaxID=1408 RepID=UPI00227F7D45|nr:phage tail tape measure protein [Bacillus pumilus]MCY7572449.1 phage tail tape measure protein [Bacillus pumilus]MEC3761515.1 phage tail tape measure protein [Bacillus pumilus]